MDKLESLTSQLSQITMYDIKSMYNQVSGLAVCEDEQLSPAGQKRRPQRQRD